MGTLAVPVIGVIAAWIQLQEKPTPVESVGMALIIGGLAILAVVGVVAGRGGGPGDAEEPALLPDHRLGQSRPRIALAHAV